MLMLFLSVLVSSLQAILVVLLLHFSISDAATESIASVFFVTLKYVELLCVSLLIRTGFDIYIVPTNFVFS